MEFFMNKDNVEMYIEMVKDYDGAFIIDKVKEYLEKGASLLELGMGPGSDLVRLAKDYKVVGSDNSKVFIEKFKEKDMGIEVIELDVIDMNTKRQFDCIYSNKVLHHLKKQDFIKSMEMQKNNLNEGGIIFMTLWKGEYKEEMLQGDIRFTYYLEKDICEIVEKDYAILALDTYTECEEADSLLVVLRKK